MSEAQLQLLMTVASAIAEDIRLLDIEDRTEIRRAIKQVVDERAKSRLSTLAGEAPMVDAVRLSPDAETRKTP